MRREFVCGTGAPAVQPLFTQTETHLERVIRRWNCKCFYFCLSLWAKIRGSPTGGTDATALALAGEHAVTRRGGCDMQRPKE